MNWMLGVGIGFAGLCIGVGLEKLGEGFKNGVESYMVGLAKDRDIRYQRAERLAQMSCSITPMEKANER